ncbi:hypothetical protein V5O48_002417 [Marasmius crinis-equi]|uniref:Uncharacterized protein n=1 Tax=Marasmius crinis-equi TaxID=585013 RepID=A0ABR3FVP4_9AGAR
MQFTSLFISALALAAGVQAAGVKASAKAGKYDVSVEAVEGSDNEALVSYNLEGRSLDARGSVWTCKDLKGCAAALAPNVAACAAAAGQKVNPFAYATCFAQALNNKINPPAACDNCYN